jgi:hypothetical protein
VKNALFIFPLPIPLGRPDYQKAALMNGWHLLIGEERKRMKRKMMLQLWLHPYALFSWNREKKRPHPHTHFSQCPLLVLVVGVTGSQPHFFVGRFRGGTRNLPTQLALLAE